MIVNLLALLLIVLLALYLMNQGWLTAVLVFVSALFASVLAIGLHELAAEPINSFRPEYGRGVAFLMILFFAFSALRIASDIVVPKGVKLPVIADRVGGAAFGFLAALTVVGSIIIGIELLPVGSKWLGFDRFAGENSMQAMDASGQPIAGVAAKPATTWLGAEGFTLAMYNLMTGGSMGGRNAFSENHPAFLTELYGKRHAVERGSIQATLPDLVKLVDSFLVNDPKAMGALGIRNTEGVRAFVVRLQIDQGSAQPKIAVDPDGYFRISPSQVRLVTTEGQLLFPVAFMDKGQVAEPIELGKTHFVLDAGEKSMIVTDWVFALPENAVPRLVEFKQLARFAIVEPKTRAYAAVSEAAYSPRKYRDNPATVSFQFADVAANGTKTPLKNVEVFITAAGAKKRAIDDKFTEAAKLLEGKAADWAASRNGWGDHLMANPAGLIEKSRLTQTANQARDLRTSDMETFLAFSRIVPMMVIAQATPSGARNVEALNKYFDDTIRPMLKPYELASDKSNDQGLYTRKVSKGDFAYIAKVKTADGFYLWTGEFKAESKAEVKPDVSTKAATIALTLKPQ